MKIIHVTHCYHPSRGGVQWFFKNVSERLVSDYGDDVTVVTTDSMYGPERLKHERISPAEEVINGVKVIRFAYQRNHIKLLQITARILRRLLLPVPEVLMTKLYGPLSSGMKHYLLNTPADAICAGSSNYHYMRLPLWKACNFFYFGSIHLHDDPSIPVLTRIQRKSIQASRLYIANTNYEKLRLIEAGINPEKIKVLGVGVDEKIFEVDQSDVTAYRKDLNIPGGALLIAYAGRIEKTKNVKILIDAFVQINKEHPDVYLLIAGAGGDYADELKTYCNALPVAVQEKIRWKINFDISEKALLFNSMDILVLPSNNESFGIVFLETWACKKPVIGADIGAVRHVISEGEDGLLMQVNDKESLCSKLNLLITNHQLRISMGAKGFEKVKKNYTWDIITQKLRQCYLGHYHVN